MASDANGSPAPGLMPITAATRVEAVITEIKRGIVLGSIKPGEKLTETYLSTALGVSRPTIREALNKVSREGLLIQEPYRGLRVADLEPQAILDIADVRVALDIQAASSILADESGRRMNRLMAAWTAYERNAYATDPVVRHDSHIAFHRGLWEAAENAFLMALWPATEAHMTIALAHDQVTRPDPIRARAVHKALIDAIRSGDTDRIKAAFIAHTVDSAHDLVALMREGSDGTPAAS